MASSTIETSAAMSSSSPLTSSVAETGVSSQLDSLITSTQSSLEKLNENSPLTTSIPPAMHTISFPLTSQATLLRPQSPSVPYTISTQTVYPSHTYTPRPPQGFFLAPQAYPSFRANSSASSIYYPASQPSPLNASLMRPSSIAASNQFIGTSLPLGTHASFHPTGPHVEDNIPTSQSIPYASSLSTFSPSVNHTSAPLLAAPNITHLVSFKLDNTNYLLWKSQFLPILISNDLLGYVDGTFPCPPQFLSDNDGNLSFNPDFSAWVRTDQSVRSWLNATLTKDVLADVHELPTSRDVWTTLERRYLDQSAANELQLKLQLQALKKGSDSMTQYLRKLKSAADSLATIGSPVSDKDLIIYALAGLPSEYESFVTTVTNSSSVATYDELRTKLLFQ